MTWFPTADAVTLYDSDVYEAFPTCATNSNDVTVASWGYGPTHQTTSYSRITRLLPGAPGWTTPVDVPTDGWDAHCGVVQIAALGTRFARLEMSSSPYRGRVRTSTDDGVTWGAASAVDWGASVTWAFPAGLCWADNGTTDGVMLAAAYGTLGIMIAASTDAGVTWASRANLPLYFGAAGEYSEPGIVQTVTGDLVLLVRHEPVDGTPRLISYRSADWGVTWVAEGVAVMGAISAPNPARMRDGALILSYRDALRNLSHSYAVSTDHGATWQTSPLNSGWQMYGQFAPRPNGRAVLVAATQVRGVTDESYVWTQTFGVVTDMIVAWSTPSYEAPDAPRVDLTISQIPPETTKLAIDRYVGGEWWTVRTPGQVLSGTSAYVEDPEAPVGVPVLYRVTAYAAGGAILAQSITRVDPLPDPPRSAVWLSDPLDADSAVLVLCTSKTDLERPFMSDVADVAPLGAAFGSSTYGSSLWGELQFEAYCASAEEHRLVLGLLRGGGVLIRAAAWRELPPLIYGPARGLVSRVTLDRPESWWSLHRFGIVPTVGPGISTVLPRRVWADYMAEAETWAAGMALYPTWKDAIRGGAV